MSLSIPALSAALSRAVSSLLRGLWAVTIQASAVVVAKRGGRNGRSPASPLGASVTHQRSPGSPAKRSWV
ncbi:MAG TPA: hypothetical protein VIJ18_17110 [Microbacteriaceae bacterium]